MSKINLNQFPKVVCNVSSASQQPTTKSKVFFITFPWYLIALNKGVHKSFVKDSL